MWSKYILSSIICNRIYRRVTVTELIQRKHLINLARKYSLKTMKLETTEFSKILTDEVNYLKNLFEDNGYELRIAGGAVRDLLAGITPKDLDFATTATPDQMKDMFTQNEIRMINMAGEKHGTITARINDKENFEITTLRIDVVTDGRRAEVEFTKDWKLDSNRRDLTINSMFLGLDGTVYDYFNGADDLRNKRVLFVGDPNTRIQEDYLRIMRYFRFYGRIANNSNCHDPCTLEAIKKHVSNLTQISGERIWQELHKTIEGRFGRDLLTLIVELGIGPYIGFPDKCNVKSYLDLCERVNTNQPVRAVTLLCGLFNDEVEFQNFHCRCKLSRYDRDLGFFLIRHRGKYAQSNQLKPYKMLLLDKIKQLDITQYIEQLLIYDGKHNLINELLAWEIPKFPVNGNMVRATVTVESGPQLGILLHKLKEEWCDKDFTQSSEDLLRLLPELILSTEPRANKKRRNK